MEGVISFCSSAYGLILSEINLFNDNCYIVFGPYTNVSGIKIGDLGPLDEYFHAGVQVKFSLKNDMSYTDPSAKRILRVETITPKDEYGNPELNPVVTVATNILQSNTALGLNKNGEAVMFHPHLCSTQELGQILCNNFTPTSEKETEKQLNEFYKIVKLGRTIEGRFIPAPEWVKEKFKEQEIRMSYLAISVQNFSSDLGGYAKIVSLGEHEIILASIENEDRFIVFPLSLVPVERQKLFRKIPIKRTLFYYIASKDLHGDPNILRAFTLNVVDDGHEILSQLERTERRETTSLYNDNDSSASSTSLVLSTSSPTEADLLNQDLSDIPSSSTTVPILESAPEDDLIQF